MIYDGRLRADARQLPIADGSVIAALAYCAGVVDSEGTIGVKRITYGMRHDNGGQPTYSERVCVKQVEPQAVNLLHSLFGGYHSTVPASVGVKGRRLFVWQVTDLRAADCLARILPFLRIKRQQAENALALRKVKDESKLHRIRPGRGHAGSSARSSEHSAAMESLYRRAKELNRVGKVVVGDVGRANQSGRSVSAVGG